MAEYITKIRTNDGDKYIDYNALANKPSFDDTLTVSGAFADAKATGDKINEINENIDNLETNKADKSYVDEAVCNINTDDLAPKDHTHTKENITDFAHTHNAEDILFKPTTEGGDEEYIDFDVMLNEIKDYSQQALEDAKKYVDEKYIFIEEGSEETGLVLGAEWSGDEAPYTQELAVEGIKETDHPHISPVYDDDLSTAIIQMRSWGMVSKAVASEGKITFTCFTNKPEVEIPIQIEVHR